MPKFLPQLRAAKYRKQPHAKQRPPRGCLGMMKPNTRLPVNPVAMQLADDAALGPTPRVAAMARPLRHCRPGVQCRGRLDVRLLRRRRWCGGGRRAFDISWCCL